MNATEERYRVEIAETDRGWRVAIVDAAGDVISERACRDAAEAHAYASTVRQHLSWLSPERFRSYYAPEG